MVAVVIKPVAIRGVGMPICCGCARSCVIAGANISVTRVVGLTAIGISIRPAVGLPAISISIRLAVIAGAINACAVIAAVPGALVARAWQVTVVITVEIAVVLPMLKAVVLALLSVYLAILLPRDASVMTSVIGLPHLVVYGMVVGVVTVG